MTLRGRLIWMLFAVLAPLLIVVGLFLYYFVESTITARFDDGLSTRAEALVADVLPKGDTVALHFDNEDMPSYDLHTNDDEKTAYFELHEIDDSGNLHLLSRSASLRDRPLLTHYTMPLPATAWNENLGTAAKLRILARPFTPQSSEPFGNDEPTHRVALHTPSGSPPRLLMLVALSRTGLESPLRTLTLGMVLAGIILAAGGILATRWALTRGLVPLQRLAREVRSISTATLGNPLNAGPLPPEIAPIQDRLNELSMRLKLAFDRERRFNTAAAHELRTPVAELRALLEVSTLRPRSVEESTHTLRLALASVTRLDHLVAALLRLSRIEANRQTPIPQDLPLAPLLTSALAEHHAPHDPLAPPLAPDLIVSVDPGLLAIVLRTILANAAEYADAGTSVSIHAALHGQGVRLTIANAASNLANLHPSLDAVQLGEPFWRHTASPTSQDHLGLGLSLAQAAARAAGVGLSWAIDSATVPPTFSVTLDIPAPAPASSSIPHVSSSTSADSLL